jgi:hypothetical protein
MFSLDGMVTSYKTLYDKQLGITAPQMQRINAV